MKITTTTIKFPLFFYYNGTIEQMTRNFKNLITLLIQYLFQMIKSLLQIFRITLKVAFQTVFTLYALLQTCSQ